MNSAPASLLRRLFPATAGLRTTATHRALAGILILSTLPVASAEGTGRVRHAPQINAARVEGSLQVLLAEPINLNGNAVITGDLLVPGLPNVVKNGHPVLGGTIPGTGSPSPSGWQITLNGNARLGLLRPRTDPAPLPVVGQPPPPSGNRSVTINSAGQSAGDWTTLRDLTLNGNAGQYAVPPGSYRHFSANGGSGFTLGVAGSATPTVYSLQSLTLNGQSTLQVAGPVILTTTSSLNLNGQSGSSAHPEWLEIRLPGGGVTLNGGSSLFGYVASPNGTVTINGNSSLTGGIQCDRLVLNGNALLRLLDNTVAVNQPPVAQPQSLATAEDAALPLTLTALDPDSSTLTYTLLTAPQHGTLSGAPPSLTYTPSPDYTGTDTFTFTAGDGTLTSAPAAISLTITPVNDAPVPADQTIALTEDTPAALTLSATDVENSPLTFTVLTAPLHGTLTGTPPNLTYTPHPDYWGPDSLTWLASDGALDSAIATVTLDIAPASDIPVASPLEASVQEDGTVDITLTGTDGDGDTLTFATFTAPAHGTIWLLGNVVTYIPHSDYSGPDFFSYTVSDGLHLSTPAPVTLTVSAVNDPPTVASGGVEMPEDTPATLIFTSYDPDADPLTWEILSPPLHGTLVGTGPAFTYSPDPNFHGPDHFTVRVTDPSGATAHGGASILITPVNDAPLADTLTVNTLEDQSVPVDLTATDVDGDPLTFTVITPPQFGILTGQAPNLTYLPADDFFGEDSFIFTVTDGAETRAATVFIAASPVNDAPIAEDGTLTTSEDTAAPVDLSTLTADIDDAPSALTFAILSPPLHGTLTGSGSVFTYTPAENWHGTDNFTWNVTDAGGLSASASVSITVTPVNDAPTVAAGDDATLTQPAFAALAATAADDGDPEGQPALTVSWTQTSGPGAAIFGNPNQLNTSAGFTAAGTYALRITVSDGEFTASDDVHVTVEPANQAPLVSIAPVSPVLRGEALPFVGSVADDGLPAGSGLVTLWSATGPGTATFTSVASLTTSATFDTAGTWTVTLRATDGEIFTDAQRTVTVLEPNHAPVVTTGPPLNHELGQPTVTLSGTVTDDGEPRGAAVTSTWTQTAGPATAVIADPASLQTAVAFTEPGDYLFTLTASDTLLSSSAAQAVHVVPPQNRAPAVNAGEDQSLTGQFYTVLTGTAGDDGMPAGSPLVTTWTQVSGPAAAVLDSAGALTTGVFAEVSGTYVFRLSATDGELAASDEVSVALTFTNEAPSVSAGADQLTEESFVTLQGLVTDDGRPAGTLTLTWEMITGPGTAVFGHPEAAVTRVDTGEDGTYVFRLTASDGEFSSTDEVSVTFGDLNQAPQVNAGTDQTAAFNLTRSDNLLANPGAEASAVGVVPASWTIVTGAWRTAAPSSGTGYPAAVEGARYFYAGNSTSDAELYQNVDVTPWAAGIDAGAQAFQFVLRFRSRPEPMLDRGAAVLEFRDAADTVLRTDNISLSPSSTQWSVVASIAAAPAGTRTVRVRLIATSNLSNTNCDVFFDALEFRALTSAPLTLTGTAADDGRPEHSTLTTKWSLISGPSLTGIADATALSTSVFFTQPGTYVFEFNGSDGVKSAADTVQITLTPGTGNGPPTVDAGTDAEIELPSTQVQLNGTVGDNTPTGALVYSWSQVSGDAEVVIDNPSSLTPNIFLPESGTFVLRLYATDGEFTAADDVTITARCPDLHQALDIVLVMDTSGSMIDMGSTRFANAKLAAVDFVNRMDPLYDRAALVRFSTTASLVRSLTESAAQLTYDINGLAATGGTAIHLGIAAARTHLQASGRADADQVIVLLTDGESDTAPAIAEANAAKASGIRVVTIALEAATGASLLQTLASVIGDYHFVRNASSLTSLYGSIARSFCQTGEPYAEAFAGPDLFGTTSNSYELNGRTVFTRLDPRTTRSTGWSKITGPGNVAFGDASQAITTATFDAPGVYVLALTATVTGTDGRTFTARDLVQLRVGQPAAPSISSGLTAWWKFDDTLQDSIGSHHLSLLPVQSHNIYEPGISGTARRFQGFPHAGVSTPYAADIDPSTMPALTIEFWHRRDVSGGGDVFQVGSNSIHINFQQDTPGDRLYFDLGNYPSAGLPPFIRPPLGVWNHVAVTYDSNGSMQFVYLNGALAASTSVSRTPAPANAPILIGSSSTTGASFVGLLDEFAIYNRALTPEEIAASYTAGATARNLPSSNAPPVVSAGPDRWLAQTGSVALAGAVQDDGLPSGSAVSTEWSLLSGPSPVNFGNAANPATTAQFTTPGIYRLQLRATDSEWIEQDTLVFTVASPAGSALASGAILWWPFDDGYTERLQGLPGAPRFTSLVPGVTGQALRLDSNVASVQVPGAATALNGGEFTIETWVKPAGFGNLFHWGVGTLADVSLFFSTQAASGSSPSQASYGFSVRGAGVGTKSVNFSATNLALWRHVTVSYSRTSGIMKAWIDGNPVASSSVGPLSWASSSFSFGIMGLSNYGGTQLDEFIVYQRALSDAEVLTSYRSGAAGKASAGTNSPPLVFAGSDFEASVGAPVGLPGVVTDDGLPDNSGLLVQWSQYSGPGAAVFSDVTVPAANVTLPLPGTYWLKLTASDGMVTSEDVVVVHAGGAGIAPPAGLVAWWPFDGDGQDALGTNHLSIPSALVSFEPGYIGPALRLTGSNSVSLPAGSPLITLVPASVTVEGWLRRDNVTAGGTVFNWRGSGNNTINLKSSQTSLEAEVYGGNIGFQRLNLPANSVSPAAWHHIAFTLDNGSTKTMRLYVDGVLAGSRSFSTTIPGPMTAFSIGWSPSTFIFPGNLDDFAVYNRLLSAAEIAAIFSAGSGGKLSPPANTAPRVTAGPDLIVELPSSATLSGTALDDALPAGAGLTTLWEQTSGPVAAVIADASLLETAVTFGAAGTYVFRLTGSDSVLSASDSLTVTVLPPQNNAPAANAGPDAALSQDESIDLAGSATDDGLPTGSALQYSWAQVSGPGTALFSDPNAPAPQVRFTATGSYVLRLTVSDSLLTGFDEVTFTVTPAVNNAPLVDAGPDRSVPAGTPLTISPQITDDGLARPWLSVAWRVISGGPYAALQSAQGGGITASFSRTGTYVMQLTAHDGELSAADTVQISVTPALTAPPAVTLTSPEEGAAFEAGEPVMLTASAVDATPGGGIDTIQFFSGAQALSAPLPADAAGVVSFVWNGAVEGTYTLTALATDFSGTTAQSTAVAITIAPSRPRLTWLNPVQHDVFQSADAVTLLVDARPGAAGAAVTSVEFLARAPGAAAAESLGVLSGAPWEQSWPAPSTEGAWELTAVATDSLGATSSAVLTVHISADLTAPPVLDILSPADAATITSPVTVTGTVQGPTLQNYTLQFRPALQGQEGEWRTLATGAAGVADGPLGALDPTLLENGPYELRLTAGTWDGGTITTDPVSVLLDGNMKIGHFAVAFEDLSVPMPGLNVTVTRSYDSRRTDSADFGVGWDLAVSSMRLVKNRPVGHGYALQSAGLADISHLVGQNIDLWCARAPLRKLVTVKLPDGTALAFKPRLEVHPSVRMYSPEPDCSVVPQNQVKVVFTPHGRTLGTLEPIDPPDVIAYPQLNDGPYGPGAAQPGVCRLQGGMLSKGLPGLDPAYEPVKFKYTSPEGAVFIVEQAKGVESVTDRNGNSLTFTPQAITHSSGQSITFTRDTAGRITHITDPAGAQLRYTYDALGRLTHFTDRTDAVTEYRYTSAAYPFYLTEIIDPLGNRAVKSLFDANGRLIGQEDADGHAVTMEHDLAAFTETVTDRLGHPTVHEYDLNGNIVKTTDALGGITLRTYDDRDRETSVTDPLGHTISKTYDAQDNILTETNAENETTSYTYNDKKQPLTITDPLGHTTTFSYDANGNWRH